MLHRITLDIDNKNKLNLNLIFAKILYKVKSIEKIEIFKSNSNGYHIIIWTHHKYTLKEQYALRLKLGDDWHRIKQDLKRKIGKQTLFNYKEKHETSNLCANCGHDLVFHPFKNKCIHSDCLEFFGSKPCKKFQPVGRKK